MSITVKEYFDKVFPEKIAANPELPKRINTVFQFDITGEQAGTWTIALTGAGVVTEGAAAAPGCTIIVSDADFIAMMEKTANPMQLYMGQKLKVKGNLPLSLKLQELIK